MRGATTRADWLAPSVGPVFVVRWVQRSGLQCGLRMYFTLRGARRMHRLLIESGHEAHIYRTETRWRELDLSDAG